MGGMIVLMVRTNSGFSYPGYIIYLSAFYTFYTMIISVLNLVKFRKLGSPILSAAKVLNFIAAMMSILGLQTAMISRFSENGEAYRKMMNTITGGFVYGIVIVTLISMAIAIYFGDWIKTVLPVTLIFLLLLVQVIYVGIRWYVKGWRETRGYY